MKNKLNSKLFERVKSAGKRLTGKTYGLAAFIGVNDFTFKGYCSEARESNLWPLLPSILEAFPAISREWLYFNEGEMLRAETTPDSDAAGGGKAPAPPAEPEMRGKLRLHPGYPDDPLGRIQMLTNARGFDALELQSVFGVDFKELKPFVARYVAARREREAWLAAGGREEDVPEGLPPIPEEWLDFFWRRYGPCPQWIRYGGGNTWGPLVTPRPGADGTERLRGELDALRAETERLRGELEEARAHAVRLEALHGERARHEADGGALALSPPAATSMRHGPA